MQIRRFEGKDVQDVLRQVKEVLGPEAIILSNKTIRSPRPGSTRALVEVVAAVDRQEKPESAPAAQPFSPWQWGERKGNQPPPPDEKKDENSLLERILLTGLYPEFVNRLKEEIQAIRMGSKERLADIYQRLLHNKLMEMIEVSGPYQEKSKIWSFVGPTGVGKTTTLVKLAAHFHLRMGKKITILTIDTYRIGAQEQLRTYSRILGVPMEVALTPEELRGAIQKHWDQDLLLIDTAGRNPQDTAMMAELKDFLTVHPAIENHLVLSATTKDPDLARIVQRFCILPIASYVITKLDETEVYGPIFNQMLRYRRPLSYLTNGQRVPEDIELATKVRVASLVLNQIQWN
jgi:flagellar biosynthesis protein FlhF